ncbi:MAG: MBL fold metallo-hydrolase [Opitutales bacterium]|nr:MBL fold metallo-hydrolase [Opitutales bacterium]
MFFQIIETSSAGNCAYLECGGANFLIDAGIGVRRLESYLRGRSLTLDDIDAVFVTHEHSDHCKSLKYFARRQAKIFANRLTCESISHAEKETSPLHWNIFEDGEPFEFMGVGVCAFSVPHDTSDAVGYKFSFEGKNLVWLTDLGKPTILAREMAKTAQILVLESNYCPRMLENSSRPYRLKTRIKGSHGHLSNSDAIEILKSIPPESVEKVYLAHISKECNSVSHIAELLDAGVGAIRPRIEIVRPFSESSTPFCC